MLGSEEIIMDWFHSLKNSKYVSKIFRTYAAVRKRLAWYFMLLFNNPYPIGKSSKEFKFSAILCVAMMLNILHSIVMLATATAFSEFILYLFTLLLAAFAEWINISSMLRLKQKVYNEKVREASEDFQLSYAETVVKLAAMYPTLELVKDTYEAWRKAYNVNYFVSLDACSMYPMASSLKFKDFLKANLRGP